MTTAVKESNKTEVLAAWRKALRHKKEAKDTFEKWLQEKGIAGKVVML